MPNIYRITAQSANRSEFFISVFEKLSDDSTRGWSVTEYYQSAEAFLLEAPDKQTTGSYVICDLQAGSGAKLDHIAGFYFNWDDAFSHNEKIVIRNQWLKEHRAMLTDKWSIEEEYVKIYSSFKVDLVDAETGLVVEEDCNLIN